MHVVYAPGYRVDIGVHVFPTTKYGRTCSELLHGSVIDRRDIIDPDPATWHDLALVHTSAYLHAVREGGLTSADLARLELPWSPPMVDGFRLATGGTLRAAQRALSDGVSVQLGGGFHHAFPDHGEGFCVFNDSAVAIQVLRRDGLIRRAAVLDCDVHHGNGTAFIFASDPAVFTCSLHQQNNYPLIKPASSLDIGLADGTSDHEYLDRLQDGLASVLATKPDVIVYLAGADPFEDDQLGGLSLTRDGLRRRDRAVLESCHRVGIPIVVLLAGGYARRLDDTVAIHVATVEEAVRVTARAA